MAVAALILRCDATCENGLLGDFDTGYSRHFVRGSVADDSLVIRVYRFHTTDGAKRYTNVAFGTTAYNGKTNAFTDTPIGRNRPAFVNRIAGWPNFANVTLNLGAAYANQDVMIRFRIGADEEVGAPGWDIDNVAVTGITNTPFTALVPETTVCTAAH